MENETDLYAGMEAEDGIKAANDNDALEAELNTSPES